MPHPPLVRRHRIRLVRAHRLQDSAVPAHHVGESHLSVVQHRLHPRLVRDLRAHLTRDVVQLAQVPLVIRQELGDALAPVACIEPLDAGLVGRDRVVLRAG